MVSNASTETLATRLRQAMAGRSVTEVASAAQVTPRTLWRILSPVDKSVKGRPDTDTVVKLAKALGCKVGWLLDGEAA